MHTESSTAGSTPSVSEVFFSRAFRPFFFGAGLFGGISIILWLVMLTGALEPASHLSARDWHVHEMIFGYFAAAMTGFLLTAVPNWTGRMPLAGKPLALLFGLWLAGRVAMFFSNIAPYTAIAADALYLPVLAFLVWREIIAGRNRRNVVVALLVSALMAANFVFHAQFLFGPDTILLAERLGLAVAAGLIMLIGGRIVPSFTRNWLMKQGVKDEPALPAPFGMFDRVAVAVATLTLVSWAWLGEQRMVGALFGVAGVLHLLRLLRWRGWTTLREPLVWILHAGYLWLVLWMLLMAASVSGIWPYTDALHALTAGAIVVMTLAVMTRASLGHSGRPLTANALTTFIYALAIAGALVRVLAAYLPTMMAWHLSGTLTAAALLLFALGYAPVFFRPRAS